jgi:hypothetical protein
MIKNGKGAFSLLVTITLGCPEQYWSLNPPSHQISIHMPATLSMSVKIYTGISTTPLQFLKFHGTLSVINQTSGPDTSC